MKYLVKIYPIAWEVELEAENALEAEAKAMIAYNGGNYGEIGSVCVEPLIEKPSSEDEDSNFFDAGDIDSE